MYAEYCSEKYLKENIHVAVHFYLTFPPKRSGEYRQLSYPHSISTTALSRRSGAERYSVTGQRSTTVLNMEF